VTDSRIRTALAGTLFKADRAQFCPL